MLADSINYLREDENWVMKVLIGGVLGILQFIFVGTILLFGYYMRVIRAVIAGEGAPEFDEWGDMAIEGLKAFIIAFVYGLVPAILVSLGFGSILAGIFAGGNGSSGGAAAGIGGGLLFFLVGAVIGLVVSYVMPVGLVRFAISGNIGDAFAFGAMRPVLTSRSYLMAWVMVIALGIGFGVVASILSFIPLLGQLLVLFASFYFVVSAVYLYARGVHEAEGVSASGVEPAGQPAT